MIKTDPRPGLKGVPCSLTLGGVDVNRFVAHDVSFDLTADSEPIVAIDSISVTAEPLESSQDGPDWAGDSLSLMEPSQAELFTIDSSTPFFWMPEKICDAFADALNLTYNDTLELYLYGDETGPEVLGDWNLNFTFTLSDLPGSSKSVDIVLGYQAFNHKLKSFYPGLDASASSPPVDYFPLRKAANDTQYTIGRVLLQEAYIAVDYERKNFSISQAKFTNDARGDLNLVPITRPPNSPFPGPVEPSTGSGELSTAAKVGIGVGVGNFAIIVVAVVGCVCIRKQRRQKRGPESANEKKNLINWIWGSKSSSTPTTSATSPDLPEPPEELPAPNKQPVEVPHDPSHSVSEVPQPLVEMPASAEVPSSYYERDKDRYLARPAELGGDCQLSRGSIQPNTSPSSPSQSLPPYSPAHLGNASVSEPSADHSSFPRRGHHPPTTGSSEISALSPDIPRRNSFRLRERSASGQGSSPPAPSPLTPSTPLERQYHRPSQNLLSSRSESETEPSRSVSRSSRFREEGIDEQPLYPRPLQPRRYSWDENG